MTSADTTSASMLAHIDRKIALVFGGLISLIMLAIFSTVGLYYQHVVERGEDELVAMLTQVLGDSISRASFSGKYHARLMIEEVASSQPQIVYIMVVDQDGRIVAHSDHTQNDVMLTHDPALPAITAVLEGKPRVIQELMYQGLHVKEVTIPYRGGYRNELLGVIRVGISKEKTTELLKNGWLYLATLLVLSLLVAMVLIYRISKHFGRPIKRLAWELQGILQHAPLLIYIRDQEGNISAASRSFMEAFNVSEEELAQRRVEQIVSDYVLGDNDASLEVFRTGVVVHDLVRVSRGEDERVYMRTKFPISRDRDGNPLDVCITAVDVTERVRAEEALKRSEAHLSQIVEERQILLEHAKDFFYKHDRSGIFTYLSPAVTQISGYTPEEWSVHYNTYLTDNPVNEKVSQYTEETLATGKENPPYRVEIRARDGRLVMLEVSERAYFEHGEVAGIIGVARDITERHNAEQLLFQEKELAQVTLKSIGDAVITTDSKGRVSYLNPIAERLTGWSNEEAQGRPHEEVFIVVDEHDHQVVESPVERVLRDNRIVELSSDANHILLYSRDGSNYSIEDSAAPIRDNNGNTMGVVLVFHDVTATRELTRRINHQATHDSLTDLVNRTEFERRLATVLESAEGDDHAVLYLDLDQFKVVNDTAGHMAGDALLQRLANLLAAKIRRHDTLARLGGDEFGVLLEDCPLEQAREIAGELLNQIKEFRFVWQGKTFAVGVSIGVVAIGGAHLHDVQSVLIAADSACYLAKDSGRNRIQVYHSGDAEMAQLHGMLDWVSRITAALEEQRFILYYQAIDPAQEDTSPGCRHLEILLRMKDEQGALVQPGTFIPAAERYNLMPTLDRWVISTVFRQFGRLENAGDTLVAINLSGATLGDEDIYAYITAQFAEHQVPFESVCFEITETAAIGNINKAQDFIDKMRRLGCRFALDDFGSGLSSFAYLKNLHIDFLKIDGTFVRDIVEDPMDYAMVDAINRVGKVMGIRTIAEYVENDAIRGCLQTLGVDLLQGYGVHKPEPFERLLVKEEPIEGLM